MTKINFSVSEQTGRTFEINKEDLLKIALENGVDYDAEDATSVLIHSVIGELGFDVLAKYEKNNDYYEMNIEELKEV